MSPRAAHIYIYLARDTIVSLDIAGGRFQYSSRKAPLERGAVVRSCSKSAGGGGGGQQTNR